MFWNKSENESRLTDLNCIVRPASDRLDTVSILQMSENHVNYRTVVHDFWLAYFRLKRRPQLVQK